MDEAQSPEGVRTAVEAVAKGAIVDAMSTAGSRKFPRPDGAVRDVAVWAVRTPGQFWLAAVDGDDVFRVATGEVAEVKVVRGWARDQLEVAGWTVPLARKTGDTAAAMVEAFAADAGGPAYPPPAPDPVTGPLAEGATGFPSWWPDQVPSDPADPWLYGYTMASEWTFNGRDGGVRTVPLTLGVRGRAVVVAARFEDQTYADPVNGPANAVTGLGRTRVEVGPYRLDGGRLDGGRIAQLCVLIDAPEAQRWAMTAVLAVEDGRGADAVALWRQALTRGFRAALVRDLAVAALAVDRPTHAVTLLSEIAAPLDAKVLARLAGWRKVLAKAAAPLRDLLDAEVTPASAPGPGWPWPPETPAEAWAAAGGSITLADPPSAPRRLQIEAAQAEAREPAAVAAAAYRVAARAWAAAKDPRAAYQTLGSALRLDPETPDHFQAAVWAYASDDSDDAAAHAKAGLAVNPAAESLVALDPPAEVLRSVAAVAESEGYAQTAARLLIHADAASADRTGRLALARRAATELNAPREAAELIEGVATQLEDSEDAAGEARPEDLWLEAAGLRAQAADAEGALQALRRAVQVGFLRAEIYRSAAEQIRDADAKTADWWAHVGHVLSAEPPVGRARVPVAKLSKARLDALHPGGAGWLEDVKRWLDGPPPPPRDQLIRGLERLESSTFGDVFSAISDVSARLEIMPPATYIYRGDDAYGLSVWPVNPPVLLVGHQHLVDGPRRLTGEALTFAVGVELAHLACGHPLLSFESSLVGTSTSAYQTFGRYAGTAETVVDLVSMVPGIDQLAKLQRLVRISRRVLTGWNTVNKASKVASPLLRWFGTTETPESGGVGRERLEGAALQFRIQADRAALLLSGNVKAAVEAVLKTSRKGVVKLEALDADGLEPMIRLDAASLAANEVIRLSSLFGWCAGLGVNDVDPSGPGV